MIILEFEIDQSQIEADCAFDPVHADAAVLEETYFLVPFRFLIDEKMLLGVPELGQTELSLPLIGFPHALWRGLAGLEPDGAHRCYLAGGGELLLQRSGHMLNVFSSLTRNTASVTVEELSRASLSLLKTSQAVLLRHVPEMQSHPAWKRWFEVTINGTL